MLDVGQLKPFILHDDYHVRFEVVKYIEDGWIQDPDVLPLVLEACAKYGWVQNRVLPACCKHQIQDEESLKTILSQVEKTDNSDVLYILNGLVKSTPLHLLRDRMNSLAGNPRIHEKTQEFLEHRQAFAEMSGEALWGELQAFSQRSEDANYANAINYCYADALIETLALHEVPDEETVYSLLQSEEVKKQWLEIFLIDLAGAHRLNKTVPLLVDRFCIDTDYMLERCNRSLARIGDVEAIHLVRKAFLGELWHYQNYAMRVFSTIRHPESEKAILALRHETSLDTDIHDRLCFCLCDLLSTHAIEWGRELIPTGRTRNWDNMRQRLLVVAEVHGIELPEAQQWRAEVEEEEEERQRHRDRMFAGLDPLIKKTKKKYTPIQALSRPHKQPIQQPTVAQQLRWGAMFLAPATVGKNIRNAVDVEENMIKRKNKRSLRMSARTRPQMTKQEEYDIPDESERVHTNDEKTLQVTLTEEAVQPIRLYYQVVDKRTLITRFEKLRCMDFDPGKNRWVWLYAHESKKLTFEKSYSSIPRKLRPIVLGSFFLRDGGELLLDLRSFERAITAIQFFDTHLGHSIARLTHAAVVNRFFDAKEQLSPKLDIFFNSSRMTEKDPDTAIAEIELLIERTCIDGNPDWSSVSEQRAKRALPEVEKFLVHFYEDGITSLRTALRMRHIMAFEHWKGNADYTLYDVIKTMISGHKEKHNGETI